VQLRSAAAAVVAAEFPLHREVTRRPDVDHDEREQPERQLDRDHRQLDHATTTSHTRTPVRPL
jgi:hypothetical protein